jgi:O-acetyl-ADP-ribose deacetylase (regulator of RNase III)
MSNSRTYLFGKSTLSLVFGDLTTSDAQVLVSSDDYLLTMGGGVSAAIRRAGGSAIALDAAAKAPARLGAVVVTTAGTLAAQYVFHAITIGRFDEELGDREVLESATRRCMQLLKELQLTSIAFPAIGAGAAQFSYSEVAATMAQVIAEELLQREEAVHASIFLLDRYGEMEELDFIEFFEEFARRVPGIGQAFASLPSADLAPSISELAEQTEAELNRFRVHRLRMLLRELDEQRMKLEEQLLFSMKTGEDEEITSLRNSLGQNQELRLGYMDELRTIGETERTLRKSAVVGPPTVFVSSTFVDLEAHRRAVRNVITDRRLFFRGMENFGANPDHLSPAALIVEEVRRADAYVGIFGVRYGSIDPASGLSMTELEFREAEASKRKMLLYVIHPDAAVPVAHMETDPDRTQKLNALKQHILSRYVVQLFRSPEDLAHRVNVDLEKVFA